MNFCGPHQWQENRYVGAGRPFTISHSHRWNLPPLVLSGSRDDWTTRSHPIRIAFYKWRVSLCVVIPLQSVCHGTAEVKASSGLSSVQRNFLRAWVFDKQRTVIEILRSTSPLLVGCVSPDARCVFGFTCARLRRHTVQYAKDFITHIVSTFSPLLVLHASHSVSTHCAVHGLSFCFDCCSEAIVWQKSLGQLSKGTPSACRPSFVGVNTRTSLRLAR